MRRVNMIVTERMKSELSAIAEKKEMNCSELIRMILNLMLYRIRGAKTRKHRREKRYRLIENSEDNRVRFSFYAEDDMYRLIANVESETDCWSKAAFIRKIFDIYLHYVSQNAEILFINLAKQAENDYNAKLAMLKQRSEQIRINNSSSEEQSCIIMEFDKLGTPLCVSMR